MKATVRPLDNSPELQEGVDRLRTLVFPYYADAGNKELHDSLWGWLANHPLASDMHRWVLVTDDDRVVGHLAATPQYYRMGGRRVVAHTPGDFQVLPEYGFHALSLMRKFFRTCENYVACDMVPAVISVETRMGGEEVGQLQYVAKLLNVARLPMPPVPAPIRRLLSLSEKYASGRGYTGPPSGEGLQAQLAPPPVRPRAPIPAPAKALLNAALWAVDQTLGGTLNGGGLKVEVLEGFDESFDALFEAVAAGVTCITEKDAAFLRWRYGPGSPVDPVTLLGVRGKEGLLGYAVLKVVARGPDKGRDANILDFTTLPGRHDVARVLLREATRYFRRAGAHIIRYRFLESPTSPRLGDLRRLGFFPRKGRRHTLLAKFAEPGLQKVAVDPANWSYSIGDGEASFF